MTTKEKLPLFYTYKKSDNTTITLTQSEKNSLALFCLVLDTIGDYSKEDEEYNDIEKLLYIVQIMYLVNGYYKMFTGKKLLKESFVQWQRGPMLLSIWNINCETVFNVNIKRPKDLRTNIDYNLKESLLLEILNKVILYFPNLSEYLKSNQREIGQPINLVDTVSKLEWSLRPDIKFNPIVFKPK